jgi:hypothetical protein
MTEQTQIVVFLNLFKKTIIFRILKISKNSTFSENGIFISKCEIFSALCAKGSSLAFCLPVSPRAAILSDLKLSIQPARWAGGVPHWPESRDTSGAKLRLGAGFWKWDVGDQGYRARGETWPLAWLSPVTWHKPGRERHK